MTPRKRNVKLAPLNKDPRNSEERVIDTAFETLIKQYTARAHGTEAGSPEWNFVELLANVYGKVMADRTPPKAGVDT